MILWVVGMLFLLSLILSKKVPKILLNVTSCVLMDQLKLDLNFIEMENIRS